MNQKYPILILAGSDQRSGPMPRSLDATQMLSGFKGTLPMPSGRCLVSELVDRFRASGRFEEPIIVGPQSVFEGLVDCEVVDVHGSLVATLECVCDLMQSRFPGDAQIAVSACDILPTVAEIRQLVETSFDSCGSQSLLLAVHRGRTGRIGGEFLEAAIPHSHQDKCRSIQGLSGPCGVASPKRSEVGSSDSLTDARLSLPQPTIP